MSAKNKRPPALTFETASTILCGCFPFETVFEDTFKQLPCYDDRHYYFEGRLDPSAAASSSQQANSLTERIGKYVLRVSSLIYPLELVRGSNELMVHLASRGICCSQPITSRGDRGRFIVMIPGKDLNATDLSGYYYPVRVLMFIPGTMMSELKTEYLTSDFLSRVGHFAGRVDAALKDFIHPAIDSYVNECWDLQHFTSLKKYIPFLTTEQKKITANTIMKLYECHIQPLLGSLKKGVIHGDLNGRNIIVQQQADSGRIEIAGLIDFGDCVNSYYLFELTTLVCYTMMGKEYPLQYIAPLIQGYHMELRLSHSELDCLYYAVLALLCTSAVKGEYNASIEPDNMHIQQDISNAWNLISFLLEMSKNDFDIA